jgi:hypothetical protein
MIINRSKCCLFITGMTVVMFISALSGCFAPRYSSSLEKKLLPDKRVAVIPITPAQVRMVLRLPASSGSENVVLGENIVKDRDEVAQVINTILNSLADGTGNPLLGPEKLHAQLKDAAVWEKIYVYLNDPGSINESWKLRGLLALFEQINIDNIARIVAIVDAVPVANTGTTGSLAIRWQGKVIIRAELFSISQSDILSAGSGEAEFWGTIGAIGGFGVGVPFGLGKTFDCAADQALREALSELFKKHREEHPVK